MSRNTTATKPVDKKEESAEMIAAKNMLREAAPFLLLVIAGVLQNTELKSARAYVMSDLLGALTGDRQSQFMFKRRVEATPGMMSLLGKATGQIRANHAKPLYNTYEGLTTQDARNVDTAGVI